MVRRERPVRLSALMTALTAFTVVLLLAAVVATVLVSRAEARARAVLWARWEQRRDLGAATAVRRDAA
jgi:hypothetical protein